MQEIEDFIKNLKLVSNSDIVRNHYLNAFTCENLALYLKWLLKSQQPRILLVGEAPGYKGCKISGIPFTSSMAFRRFDHPLLNELKEQVKFEKLENEATSTIIWQYLSSKNITPIFWNSFPFHPHHENNENANRPPNENEIKTSIKFLHQLHEIFKPDLIAGIGNSGHYCLKIAFSASNGDYQKIRHPSFGGKSDFIHGMDSILSNYS